jgi:hypothetical protein
MRAAVVAHRIRQHLYFRTSKASKLPVVAHGIRELLIAPHLRAGPSCSYIRRLLGTRSTYVSIRQRTSAYASTSGYVSIRQHTSGYVRIRQHAAAWRSASRSNLSAPRKYEDTYTVVCSSRSGLRLLVYQALRS